jgi:hypothetical protein
VIDGIRPIPTSYVRRILGHKIKEALRIQERFICKEVLIEVPGKYEVPIVFGIVKMALEYPGYILD